MKKNKLFTNILAMALVMIAMIVVVITVGLFRTSPEETLEGQAETTDYRLSSKVPARVLEIRVKEGDFVHRGDTLVVLEAPDVEAKLSQANAAYDAAKAMEEKAYNGARQEDIQAAYEMWQKAKAAVEVTEKTYNRVQRLFESGVMAEQKRDEAKAQYEAAKATEKAAKAKYDMAVNGTRKEDKSMAQAQAERAKGAIAEVNSYINETVLTATADGQITEIFPEVGELVGTGAPIMNVSVVSDVWFTFNLREDKLKGYSVGTKAEVYVPAVDKTIPVRITLMKDVGSFAVWKATKALDDIDLKTFEVQAHPLQPVDGILSGMSAVLKKSHQPKTMPTGTSANKKTKHHEHQKQDSQKTRHDRPKGTEDVFASSALSLLHDHCSAVLPYLSYLADGRRLADQVASSNGGRRQYPHHAHHHPHTRVDGRGEVRPSLFNVRRGKKSNAARRNIRILLSA